MKSAPFALYPELRLIIFWVLLFQFTSCANWQGNDGYRHTLVLGIGMLKEKVLDSNAASVSKTGIVGVAIRTGSPNTRVTVGFDNSLTVQIPTGWQGIISVQAGKAVQFSPTKKPDSLKRRTRK
jgi:hypothetical protein